MKIKNTQKEIFNFLIGTLQRPLKKNKGFAVILDIRAQL